MTDRELKKLSRLELLELLLEQTKINEELRLELDEIKKHDGNALNIGELEKMTERMNCALSQIDALSDKLSQLSENGEEIIKRAENVLAGDEKDCNADETVTQEEKSPVTAHKPNIEDENLYCRILQFYSQPEKAKSPLPIDILFDVRVRLRGILNERE